MPEVTRFPYFVDNQWHQSAGGMWIDSENPADGTVWAQVPDCGEADVDRVPCTRAANRGSMEGATAPITAGRASPAGVVFGGPG